MKITKLNNFQMDTWIQMALQEDISSEDFSTNAIYEESSLSRVSLLAKQEGILAGLDVFRRTFSLLDENIQFVEYKSEGDEAKKGDKILDILGNTRSILSAERVALNFLQHMSGIASYTHRMIQELGDDAISIVDTRKTTPNMRIFEKYAVRVGGGKNHRYNLSDGIMLKDNHIAAAGSVTKAVKLAKTYAPFVKKIEVEVENLEMLKEALEVGVDIIMLDNMDLEMVKQAITIIDGRALIECSGNIDISNVKKYKGLAIDYISSGALTHSAKRLDFSMKHLRSIHE